MRAHAEDLRAEILASGGSPHVADALVLEGVSAALSEADRAMLDFAVRLTRAPAEMRREDVLALGLLGFSDTAIHDIVQAAALFNYYNRLADGLGIDLEPEWLEPAP